jgi:hypothetical protein
MPTIDIPDRICPHCGGTKWSTEYRKKPTKANPDKKVIRYRCAIRGKERYDKWTENNPDKWKSYTRRQKLDGYWRTPKMKEYYRLKAKRESETASDNFIKAMVMKSVEGISRSDISQKLIDITRKHLLLIRQLNQLENEKAKKGKQKSQALKGGKTTTL